MKKNEPRPCCILFFYINNKADVPWPDASSRTPAAPHCSASEHSYKHMGCNREMKTHFIA